MYTWEVENHPVEMYKILFTVSSRLHSNPAPDNPSNVEHMFTTLVVYLSSLKRSNETLEQH